MAKRVTRPFDDIVAALPREEQEAIAVESEELLQEYKQSPEYKKLIETKEALHYSFQELSKTNPALFAEIRAGLNSLNFKTGNIAEDWGNWCGVFGRNIVDYIEEGNLAIFREQLAAIA